MKFKLIRYNNTPIEFDITKIINITANGGLLYVKVTDYVTHSGYMIIPCN